MDIRGQGLEKIHRENKSSNKYKERTGEVIQ
jgi:hypothetical protein